MVAAEPPCGDWKRRSLIANGAGPWQDRAMGARAELCVREPLLRRWLRLWRYGEPVIVVSGLPRSGTSMMMRMLEAGGLPTLTDGCRTPDPDNPMSDTEWNWRKVRDQ